MVFGRKPKAEKVPAAGSGTEDGFEQQSVAPEHLRVINRLLAATSGTYEVTEVLELLVREIVEALNARWGTIKLSSEEKDAALTMIRRPGIQAGSVPRVIENTAFFLVMGTGRPLVINDLSEDKRFPSDGSSSAQSLMAMPIRFAGEIMGVLTVVDRNDEVPFSKSDQGLASYLASEAGPIIKNASLMEEALQQKALEHERDLAESVWRRLLPEKLPVVEGYDLAARCKPARQVGGDCYDAIHFPDGRVLVMLGDVTGSGMPAALLMSNLQAVMRATARAESSPPRLVGFINEHMCATTSPDRFATLFLGVLDPADGTFEYVNAGHNPPYVFGTGGCERELAATGIPVGFMPDAVFESETITLKPGCRLVMFSDGITEATSAEDEMFGEDRLKSLIEKMAGETADTVVDTVLSRVDTWVFDSDAYMDDCTVVTVGRL